jgi:DNA polymerase/3'-5' exonuclease PolX
VSQGEKVGLSTARAAAERLVSILSPACVRIETAGSIRRGVPLVSDIEIVAIPRMDVESGGDLWGTPVEIDQLAERLYSLRSSGALPLRAVEAHRADGSVDITQRDGPSYKALLFEGFPVDLFIVHDPAQWGVIFTIRTGPAEWSHRLVTDCKRLLRRVEGGYLYRSGKVWPCPTEEDFFVGIGQPWIEPADRAPQRVALRAEASL